MENYSEKCIERNNRVYLNGEIISPAEYSHEVFGEGFYEMQLSVKRLSGQNDVIPVTVSERLIARDNLTVGSTLCGVGQFRSYNKICDGKSKLMLTVFIRELLPYAVSDNPNSIVLSGYICKKPIYRTTPFNREIADMLIAVNRAYNKSDYIPCIAWGRNARFVSTLEVGEKIALAGRIQSREYNKKISDTEQCRLTAYEVSVSKLCACSGSDGFRSDFESYGSFAALDSEMPV